MFSVCVNIYDIYFTVFYTFRGSELIYWVNFAITLGFGILHVNVALTAIKMTDDLTSHLSVCM